MTRDARFPEPIKSARCRVQCDGANSKAERGAVSGTTLGTPALMNAFPSNSVPHEQKLIVCCRNERNVGFFHPVACFSMGCCVLNFSAGHNLPLLHSVDDRHMELPVFPTTRRQDSGDVVRNDARARRSQTRAPEFFTTRASAAAQLVRERRERP